MAVTTAISQSTIKKSWADIVKGRSESKVEPLRPAARGTHRCLCTGEFLVMLGHYGWIMALQDIDHPEADRHGGRIYLRASDLRPGYTPKQGDEVTFFLYADDNGLGAEDCFSTHDPHPPQPPVPPRKQSYTRPKTSWGTRVQHTETKKGMNADAKEFVPTVLVSMNTGDEEAPTSMNAEAKEFVPAPPGLGPSLNAEATEFVPFHPSCNGNQSRNMFCAINVKRFYDDDDDSSDDGTESTASDFSGRVLVAPGLSACFVSEDKLRNAQAELDIDTDSDSWCDDDETDAYASVVPVKNQAEAVEQVKPQHPWHARKARRELLLDALAKLNEQASVPLPAELAPPGLAPPAPPGLA